jgi:hypothetical protein
MALLAAATAVSGLIGCGGNDDTAPSRSPEPAPAQPATPPAPPPKSPPQAALPAAPFAPHTTSPALCDVIAQLSAR